MTGDKKILVIGGFGGLSAAIEAAPFSKMAHVVYRTVAMVFARHVGNNLRLHGIINN